jgi:hypothetical protein
MSARFILFLILGLDASILFFQTSTLSISYYESLILYGDLSFLQQIIKISIYFFGNNDFALRLPMIILHLLSIVLLYKISHKYISNERNRLWLIVIFILLPGVISSAIIVDSAGLIIFGLFLFVYIYENFSRNFVYFILALYMIIDGGFVYLFFALMIFSIYKRDKFFFIFNLFATLISLYLYDIGIMGGPKGHFLDSLAIYSAIFTPMIFIYMVYVLYRKYLIKDLDILWFLSSTAFIFSLVLSFRQQVTLENFAPYLMLALPLVVETFYHSYRVRLKIFRTKYKIAFIVSLVLLILNALIVFFNKELYRYIENPQKHFAYKMHIAKELAEELKSRKIECIKTDFKMSNRLKFYSISSCDDNILIKQKLEQKVEDSVTISYNNKIVYNASVTKLNIK